MGRDHGYVGSEAQVVQGTRASVCSAMHMPRSTATCGPFSMGPAKQKARPRPRWYQAPKKATPSSTNSKKVSPVCTQCSCAFRPRPSIARSASSSALRGERSAAQKADAPARVERCAVGGCMDVRFADTGRCAPEKSSMRGASQPSSMRFIPRSHSRPGKVQRAAPQESTGLGGVVRWQGKTTP